MSEPISNRYDFVILFDVENGNPNGDPDAGNMPRVDPETGFGLVTDVCLKRKIRNYVETVKEDSEGYRIYIKDQVPLQRSDAEALTYLGVDKDLKSAKKDDPLLDGKIRDFMCRNFYDIRTFGAVMTTFVKGALNCGQVRGPVQIGFARSVDPILPQEDHDYPCGHSPQSRTRRTRIRKWDANTLSLMAFIGPRVLCPLIWPGKSPAFPRRTCSCSGMLF